MQTSTVVTSQITVIEWFLALKALMTMMLMRRLCGGVPLEIRLQNQIFNQLQRNLKVDAIDDNWYKVRLSQDGETEYRQVKVLSQDGHILIDDVR